MVFSRQMFWHSKSETAPCSRRQQRVFVYESTWSLNFLWSGLPFAYAPLTSPSRSNVGACTLALLMACNWGPFDFCVTWRVLTFCSSTVYTLFVEECQGLLILHSSLVFFIPTIQAEEGLLAHRRTFINAIFTTIALQIRFCFLLFHSGFLALRAPGPKNRDFIPVCRAQIYKDDATSVFQGQ